MENDGNVFTRNIGPLPGWVWVIAGVAGLTIIQQTTKKKSSTGELVETQPYYFPQVPLIYGDTGGSGNTIEDLAQLISLIPSKSTTVIQQVPLPGNPPGGVVSPGNSGTATVQQPPIVPVTASTFAQVAPPDTGMHILGTITGGSGYYSGFNVAGGAPVYANIGGRWEQFFNAKTLPVGTTLATPSTFEDYISSATSSGFLP